MAAPLRKCSSAVALLAATPVPSAYMLPRCECAVGSPAAAACL